MASSPLRTDADPKEQLEWYKVQYAQLEADLSDFQLSSKELEEQLEKDVEAAEKNERKWKEQVEKLTFEVEEWKTKHRQSKVEANSAQNALQKEITTMRETNRALQLKLRDIEVMNDDYERQARNTESSLEDLESKYSSAIEQRVLLDEEIKLGEQERESLRIEAQRLRDELGDLKVESEITLEKLRLASDTISTLRGRKPNQLAVDGLRARSPLSEASGMTPLSPTASTPPPKPDSAISDALTPPSPPLSDAPPNLAADQKASTFGKRGSLAPDYSAHKPSLHSYRTPAKHSRGASVASSGGTAASDANSMRPPASRHRPTTRPSHGSTDSAARTESLSQIRGLIGRMQKIEERVHSARSKLPAPSNTTPRGSPRTGVAHDGFIPSSVTVRRSSKRTSASIPSSTLQSEDSNGASVTATNEGRRTSHVKRLSFGLPRPTSEAGHRSDMLSRPASALDGPPAYATSRPSSRQSVTRPASRTGARTAEPGHYASTNTGSVTMSNMTTTSTATGRSQSSAGGSYAHVHSKPRGHRTSASVSELRKKANEAEEAAVAILATPNSRRTTLEKSGILTPSALPRRQSGGGLPRPLTKRISHQFGQVTEEEGGGSSPGSMGPPPSRKRMSTDVGETY